MVCGHRGEEGGRWWGGWGRGGGVARGGVEEGNFKPLFTLLYSCNFTILGYLRKPTRNKRLQYGSLAVFIQKTVL